MTRSDRELFVESKLQSEYEIRVEDEWEIDDTGRNKLTGTVGYWRVVEEGAKETKEIEVFL